MRVLNVSYRSYYEPINTPRIGERVYPFLLLIHVISAIALVGPMMLTPRWIGLLRSEIGRAALRDLHRQTGMAGWSLAISGLALLGQQHWTLLGTPWMQFSIALFAGIQVVDHGWADRQEELIEQRAASATSALRTWLIVKLAAYVSIVALMSIKPVLGV
jgi:uncharacterized membrane protein